MLSRKRCSPRIAPRTAREASMTLVPLVRENARRAKCRSQAKALRCVFNVLVERGAARNCRGVGPRQGIAANRLVPTVSHRPVFQCFQVFISYISIGPPRAYFVAYGSNDRYRGEWS